jgi:WD40 repeat protein
MARYVGVLAAVFLAGGVGACDRSLQVVHPRSLPAGAIVPCGEVYLSSPLEFIAGGKYLVVGDQSAPYAVDVETGAAAPGPSGRVVAVSRSGLVVFDETYSVETERRRPPSRQMGLWDLSARPPRLVRSWTAGPNDWRCAFSPDGKHLAFLKNERVWLCNAADGASARQVTEEAASPLAFSPDGNILACVATMTESRRSVVALWNVAEGRLLHTLDLGTGYNDAGIETVIFSADGQTLIVRHSYILPPPPPDLDPLGLTYEPRPVAETVVYAVACGAELLRTSGNAAVTGDRRFLIDRLDKPDPTGAGLAVYDLSTGREARRLRAGWPGALPQGTYLYAGRVPSDSAEDRTCKIGLWDLATGAQVRSLPPVEDWWDCTALSPDGRLVVLSTVSRMRVADFATGRTVLEVYKPPRGETGIYIKRIAAFSPDGKRLVFSVGCQGFIANLDVIRAAGG